MAYPPPAMADYAPLIRPTNYTPLTIILTSCKQLCRQRCKQRIDPEAGMAIGEILVRLRTQFGHEKQRDMARLLGWDPSRVSRLESGASEPSAADIKEYLTSLDPVLAMEFGEFLKRDWNHVPKPSYLHSDRASLMR